MHRRLSRRQLMYAALVVLGWQGAVAGDQVIAYPATLPPFLPSRPLKLGTTFSQLQCRYLGLDVRQTFRQVCSLGFDLIRLCSYWNELEPASGQFDFTTLDWLLAESQSHEIEVVLTLGMKTPRWPEFHFPNWLMAQQGLHSSKGALDQNRTISDLTLRLIEAVMRHTRHAPHLRYWQVENEPLTRLEITAGRWLRAAFLAKEVDLVRQLALPGQTIVMTNAISLPGGNLAEDEAALQVSQSLADCVGINVYTRVPSWQKSFYLKPLPTYWKTLKRWQQQITKAGKAAWITEAQAEPWEPHQLVPTQQLSPPSASPWHTTQLVTFLGYLGYETVMLWGCEYWYWQQQQGRQEWWEAMQQLIES